MALFGLGKKTFTFGLDIGSSSIKAIELHEGKSGWVLSAFAQVALPRDVISEGSIKPHEREPVLEHPRPEPVEEPPPV